MDRHQQRFKYVLSCYRFIPPFWSGRGTANEVIYGVLPDDNNCIWLSTNLGIIRFYWRTLNVKNFDMNDGLQSNEFNWWCLPPGKGWQTLFRGVYGLNVIDPAAIDPVEKVSQVTLTNLEILGKKVLIAGIDLEERFNESG